MFLLRKLHSSIRTDNKMCSCQCKIGPSILNADFGRLYEDSKNLLDCGADYLHLDVMDGHFVPNISFGTYMVKCLREKLPGVFFDMHMMVSEPAKWVDDMADAGANMYTFHIEATKGSEEVETLIQKIKDRGMKVGIGVKPKTDIEVLLPYMDKIDMVLVMTVEPGFGGQKFMNDMMPKVKFVRGRCPDKDIEVDGGVSLANIDVVTTAGANMIVSGSFVVKHPQRDVAIRELRERGQKGLQSFTP